MTVQSMSTLFAMTALAADAAVLVLVAGRLLGRRAPLLADLVRWSADRALLFGAIIAAVSMAGSLYYSEIAKFIPCEYCWYQRIAMYPLVVILGFAAVRRDYFSRLPALTLAVIGFGWSVRHWTVQQWPSSGGSCSVTVPCSTPYVDKFGFLTIPWMAGSAFLLIITLLSMSALTDRDSYEDQADDDRPSVTGEPHS